MKKDIAYKPDLKKSRLIPDTVTQSSWSNLDCSKLETESRIQLTLIEYLDLVKLMNSLVNKESTLVLDTGETFGKLILTVDIDSWKTTERKYKQKREALGPSSFFFLNWVNDQNKPTEKYRGMRVSLVQSGNQWFLNMHYTPVKFLTGQNILPIKDKETWFDKPIVHTPAGYMKMGLNILGLHLWEHGVDLKKYVKPENLRWQSTHLAELVNCKSQKTRDSLLTFIDSAWDWHWSERIGKQKIQYSPKDLFRLEVKTYQNKENSDEPPSVHVSRVSVDSSTRSKQLYSILFYPKDVEVENNEGGTDDEEVKTAIQSSIRLEFRITSDLFKIDAIRKFVLGQGWLTNEDMVERGSWVSTLSKMFPTQEALEKRWVMLSQVIWQESSITTMFSPPSAVDIKTWADEESKLMSDIVALWLKDFRSPLPRAREAFNRKLFGDASSRKVEAAYLAFRVKWGFDLNRVPKIALALIHDSLCQATFNQGERSKIKSMEYDIDCLYDAGMRKEALLMERDLIDTISKTKATARSRIQKLKSDLAFIKPNKTTTLRIR